MNATVFLSRFSIANLGGAAAALALNAPVAILLVPLGIALVAQALLIGAADYARTRPGVIVPPERLPFAA